MVPLELVSEKNTEPDDTHDMINSGKVTKLNKNMTEEELKLMGMNKAKRAKKLAAKSS